MSYILDINLANIYIYIYIYIYIGHQINSKFSHCMYNFSELLDMYFSFHNVHLKYQNFSRRLLFCFKKRIKILCVIWQCQNIYLKFCVTSHFLYIVVHLLLYSCVNMALCVHMAGLRRASFLLATVKFVMTVIK